jgi:3-hydroxybutyrate dehydrogenase
MRARRRGRARGDQRPGRSGQVESALATVRGAGGGEARHFPGDLRDPGEIEAMLAAVAAWAAIDVLVNCAGVQHTAPIAEMPASRWDAILAINLSAAFHCMRLALPAMRERGFGRVINVASVHGLVASVNKAPYVASKFGLVGLSKVAALEYADAR